MGVGEGLLLLSNLGSAPWTVLTQGVSLASGISMGWISVFISLLVMLCWLPLKLKIGLGTLLNVIIIAISLEITTTVLPFADTLFSQFSYFLVGIFLFGCGTAFYLTCHQGSGPRDGLMVGLSQRFNCPVGVVRTMLEVSVCSLGYYFGGTIGVGTLLFAFGVGWIIQHTLKILHCRHFR